MGFFSQNMRLGRGARVGKPSLIDFRINQETGLAYDAKGNMNPVINQVPVFVSGVDDIAQTNISLSGLNYVHGKIIFKKTSGNIVTFSDGTTSTIRFEVSWYSDNKLYIVVCNGSVAHGYVNLTDYDFKEIEFLYDGTGVTNADRAKLWVDGVAQTLTFTGTIPSSLGTNSGGLKFNRTGAGVYGDGEYLKFQLFDSSGNITEDINFQSFSGDKIYNTVSSNHATITGSGSWWTRADGIPSMNQAKGFKLVSLDSGANEAYIPLAVSDDQIKTDFPTWDSITELTQDGKSFLNDGSELDLHPTVSDLVVGLGDELVVNGGFDTDASWIKQTGWSISGGVASCDGSQTGNTQLTQSGNYYSNKTYLVSINVNTAISGNVGLIITNFVISLSGTTGLRTAIFSPTADTSLIIIRGDVDFIGSIDNVSVKEITTLSDHLDSIEAANPGLDLNAVIAGETILPTENFKYSLLKNPLGDNHSGIVGVFDGASDIVAPTVVNLGKSHIVSLKMYANNLVSTKNLIGISNTSNEYIIAIDNGSRIYYKGDGVNAVNVAFTFNLHQWYDIRIERVNNSVSFYVDNIQIGTTQTLAANNDATFMIIGSGYLTRKWIGYISDVNINNQSIYPLSGDVIDTVSQLPATNNGVTFTSLNKVTKGIKLLKP